MRTRGGRHRRLPNRPSPAHLAARARRGPAPRPPPAQRPGIRRHLARKPLPRLGRAVGRGPYRSAPNAPRRPLRAPGRDPRPRLRARLAHRLVRHEARGVNRLCARTPLQTAFATLHDDLCHEAGPQISMICDSRRAIPPSSTDQAFELRAEVQKRTTTLFGQGWKVPTISLAQLAVDRVRVGARVSSPLGRAGAERDKAEPRVRLEPREVQAGALDEPRTRHRRGLQPHHPRVRTPTPTGSASTAPWRSSAGRARSTRSPGPPRSSTLTRGLRPGVQRRRPAACAGVRRA